MRTLLPLKCISRLLLLVVFLVTLHGAHENAHAMQGFVVPASPGDSVITHGDARTDDCPCAPSGEHQDCDDCSSCINCACHPPLAAAQPVVHYRPMVISLRFFDPYQHLPEVVLPKFIPPQIQA